MVTENMGISRLCVLINNFNSLLNRTYKIFLGIVLILPISTVAETNVEETAIEVMPDVEVYGKRPPPYERPYRKLDGKRMVSGPYGEADAILKIAAETKHSGEKRRVSVRGLKLPSNYDSSFIDLYQHQFPADCGGIKYSYYEGDNFKALGYHYVDGQVIIDSLESFNPFVAPTLWGPYDQILGADVFMHVMMGDDRKDGMHFHNGAHFIGLTPLLSEEEYASYGTQYKNAIQQTLTCLMQRSE